MGLHLRSTTLLIAVALLAVAPSARAQGAAAADTAAPRRVARHSWTSDRREYVVGDVITVLVDESTLASQDKQNSASESKKRDAGIGFQTTTSGTKIGFNTNNDGSSDVHGASTRQNRFQTEVSVRVVAVSPTGLLQIKGQKVMNVDKNTQEVSISGWVRPQDISTSNLIDGFRVADGELTFSEKGENLAAPKGGIISRLIGKLWP